MSGLLDAWLSPALRSLLRLRIAASIRALGAKLRTPAGIVAVLAASGFIAMCIVIRLTGAQTASFVDPAWVARVGPLGLALFWAAQVTIRGGGAELGFTPPEIDQLFAAPCSTSQLIRYKLVLLASVWLVTGLLLAPMMMLYTRHPLGGLLAGWLLFPGLQLSSMVVGLLRSGPSRILQRIGGVLLLSAMVVIAGTGLPQGVAPTSIDVLDHPVTRAVLSPFALALRLFTADRLVDLVVPAAALVAFNGALVGMVELLGHKDWLEGAAAGATARASAVARMRSGGVSRIGGVWKVSVPRLPRLGGVGPVAWRRLLELVRRPVAVLALSGLVVLAWGSALAIHLLAHADPELTVIAMATFLLWGIVFVPGTLRLDFRDDLDRMDQLLALPVSPLSLVVGQLLPIVALISAAAWLVIAGIAVLEPSVAWICGIAAVVAPALVLLVVSVENAIFLWFPVRMESGEAALASVGSNLLAMAATWAVHLVTLGVAGGVGGAAYVLGAGVVGSVALGIGVIATVVVVSLGLAARRVRWFDPSRHVPA